MADEIIAKYKADLKDYNSQIKKGTGQAEKDFKGVDESASGLGKTIGKIGAAMAAAFAVDRIVSFTAEASKLAAQGEGIRKAFERVGDPKLLQGLRDATRGTVSDLELMKNAVRASNFKIPLQDLAKLFEFARRRAKETGEEVDYLVNSIVLGIGRKSPLILDNLGISAVELRKKLKGVGVQSAEIGDIAKIVGDIATEELGKMGEEAETTKDKMDKLTASTDNLKEALGTIVNEAVGPLAAGLANIATAIADELTEMDRLRDELAGLGLPDLHKRLSEEEKLLDEAEQSAVERIGRVSDAQAAKIQEEVAEQRERVAIINELIDLRSTDLDLTEFTTDRITELVDAYRELNIEQEKLITINSITEELKAMAKELKEAAVGGREFFQILDKMNAKQKELFEAQAQTKLFEHLKEDAENAIPAITDVIVVEETLADLLKEAYGEEAQSAMEDYRQREMELADQAAAQAEKDARKRKDLVQAHMDTAVNAAYAIADIIGSIQQASINYEQQLLDEQLEGGIISRERYERETAKLRKESAKQAKEMALFEATTGTAMAVMNALSDTTVPYYLAVINAATAAALGAAEIATIASQPIPQFAKGTKNAPAGFKWVGEEGPELIYDKGGYPIITHRESMKIMEKYHIPSINYDAVERGGFEGLADSARLNGFNDSNMLFATDRLRNSNKDGFKMLAEAIVKAGKPKRGGYA